MDANVKQYHENKKRGVKSFPLSYYKEKYSNHMIKLHWHSEIELLYGISGELAVSVSDEKYILREGIIVNTLNLPKKISALCWMK